VHSALRWIFRDLEAALKLERDRVYHPVPATFPVIFQEQASGAAPLAGDELKAAVLELEAETRARIAERQQGIPTFGDGTLLSLVRQLRELDQDLPWEESVRRQDGAAGRYLEAALERLRLLLERRRQGRFVDYRERFVPSPEGPRSGRDVGAYELAASQGVLGCMHWKGVPLFKSVYDFSIYSMLLWELRPRTILELGSGMGASAVWMADLLRAFEIDGHVYSVDLARPELRHGGVSFLAGDCRSLHAVFPRELLAAAPHPWLLVEDAHVDVGGVLSYFHPFFVPGDYLVIEDSGPKQEEIGRFLAAHPGCYKLDSRYTDFFGRNATSAGDSIFVRF